MLRFNTAIFYDIENLTKGQSFSKSTLKGLSLTSIYQQIRSLDFVDHICLQRAYANWGDARLSVLKDEINALGIDPIQVFGFSRFLIKNAADIQLVVDAMEINFSRGLIDTYVIVSGDGGFASLAKKLHEYSRRVVVCAYRNAANETLKAVSDHFIELEPPEEDKSEVVIFPSPPSPSTPSTVSKNLVAVINHPFVVSLSEQISPVNQTLTRDLIFDQGQVILEWFKQDPEAIKKIKISGIHLSAIREAFKYVMPEFKPEIAGFAKFAELLQFLCQGTDLCVGVAPPSNTLLLWRNSVPNEIQVLPDITTGELHTTERYQSLLSQGKVRISFTNTAELQMVCTSLLLNTEQVLNISGWLELLGREVPNLDPKTINNLLFTLIHTEILVGSPLNQTVSEQVFQVKHGIKEFEEIEDMIQKVSLNKLQSILGSEFNPNIFNKVFNLGCEEV